MIKKLIKRIWKPPKKDVNKVVYQDEFGISHHLGTNKPKKVLDKHKHKFYLYE